MVGPLRVGRWAALAVCGAVWAAAACSAQGDGTEAPSRPSRAAVESPAGRALLEGLRARFTFQRAQEPADFAVRPTVPSTWAKAAVAELPAGTATFDEEPDAFVPNLPQRPEWPVEVRLPQRANEPFTLTEPVTGVSLGVSLVGARAAKAEVASGYVVYRAALAGDDDGSAAPHGTVLQRPYDEGLEDYVLLERAPVGSAVSYELELGEKVAGLRLLGDVLEILDAGGAPRLRMRAPYLTDASGTRHAAKTSIEGCAHDTDPRGPWGRPVTEPGARHCTVRVSWEAAQLAYPALLDPQWVATTNMVTARGYHTVTPFPNPLNASETLVLIAGGASGGAALANAEIYNPNTNPPTAAATAALGQPRFQHSATFIQHEGVSVAKKRVVVAGGLSPSASNTIRSSEYYDPATGTWTGPPGPCSAVGEFCLSVDRRGHTATGFPYTLANSQGILLAGGRNSSAIHNTVEMYGHDGSKLRWFTSWNGAIPNLNTPRSNHGAAVFSVTGNNLEILVAGGFYNPSTNEVTNSTEIFTFNPTTYAVEKKSSTAMTTARASFDLVGLADKYLVVMGGYVAAGVGTDSVEYFDTGGWHAAANKLSGLRYGGATQALRASGRVLLAGGAGNVAFSELYDRATNTVYSTSPLVTGVDKPVAPSVSAYIATPSAGVAPFDFSFGLVTGGYPSGQTATNTVQKWTPLANGGECGFVGDCTSLHCVLAGAKKYCCNSACTGGCATCATGACLPIADGNPGTGCGSYLCDGTVNCPTTCVGDADCVAGTYCDASGHCVGNKVQGDPCNDGQGQDCNQAGCRLCGGNPGRCVDGYCCSSTCADKCDRCDLPGKLGLCSLAPDGASGEPLGCAGNLLCDGTSASCPTACVSNADCVSTHYCDQTQNPKVCVPKGKGTPCTTGGDCAGGFPYCADSVCCDTTCTEPCAACNLAGTNGACSPVPAGTTPSGGCAAGLLCNGSNLGCPAGCTSDASCASGYYCASDSTCKPKKSQGQTCNAGSGGDCLVSGCGVCGSAGGCVDGVCCNSACSGSCDACNVTGSLGTCSPAGAGTPGNPSCAPYECSSGSSCATTCASNNDCASGYYCDGTNHCVVQAGVGNACANQSQCGSGLYCVDGVCCTTDCTGTCQACSAAKKGSGANGICGPIADNSDPDSECGDAGASTCGTSGMCDGASKCKLYPSGTVCGTGTSCSGGQQTNYTCNGLGSCLGSQSTNCAPYVCKGATCGTTCTSDTECTGSTYCNTSTSQCVPLKSNGASCTAANQCDSGNCVDGYCCNGACAGGCDRCDQAGALGTCTILGAGATPVGCPSSTGFLCSGSSAACPTTCTNDSSCASGYYCASDSTCKAKKGQGLACNAGVGGDCLVAGCGVCTSGNCVDGVCCNSTCNGPCDACNVSGSVGTCSPAGAGTPGSPSCQPYECGTGAQCAGACASNADCVAGYYCDTVTTNQCLPQAGVGTACANDAQCGSGLLCRDGVCCSSDCSNPCMACSAAKKGQGVNGLCDYIVSGTDPDNECATEAAATCGKTGSCDGSGKCALYPASTTCGTGTSCSGGQETSYQCNGLGLCQPSSSSSCAPYVCNGAVCGTTCAADTACVSGYYCNTTTSKCEVKKANGSACTATSQCQGYCVDGVCCDTQCTGQCFACSKAKKGTGDDGVCGPIAKGADPDAECAADPVNGCQKNGFCDGAGACDLYAAGTACGSASCVGNSAVGNVCNTFHECKNDQTGVPCQPYVCANGSCPSSCSTSAQCVSGYFCKAGVCTAAQANGSTCAADGECTSGHCVDGYCCDSNCNGQCQACDVTGNLGKCVAVTGAPHGSRTACSGTGTCGGACDGADGTKCGYPGATTLCTGTKCTGSVFEPWTCDGAGACVKGTSQDCGNYACDSTANACKTTCASDTDCATGSQCDTTQGQCAAQSSSCADPFTVKQANGQTQSCAPYKCLAGACQQQCDVDSDCASGYECNSSKACVTVNDAGTGGSAGSAGSSGASGSGTGGSATGGSGTGGKKSGGSSGDDGGCGCSVPTQRSSLPFAGALALGLALALRRRRGGQAA